MVRSISYNQMRSRQVIISPASTEIESALDQMFPQLSRKTILINRLQYQQEGKSTIINEQTHFNKFVKIAYNNPQCFLHYYFIDTNPNEKQFRSEIVELIGLEERNDIAKLEDVFESLFKGRNRKGELPENQSQNLTNELCAVWGLFNTCLKQMEKVFESSSQKQWLLKNSYEFYLTLSQKEEKRFRVLAKINFQKEKAPIFFLNEFISVRLNKMNFELIQISSKFQNKGMATAVASFQKLKSTIEAGELQNKEGCETFFQCLFKKYGTVNPKYLRLGGLTKLEDRVRLKEKDAIQLLTQIYRAHINHMTQYMNYSFRMMGVKGQMSSMVEWSLVQGLQKEMQQGFRIVFPGLMMNGWLLGEESTLFSNKYSMFRYLQPQKFYNYAHFEAFVIKVRNHKFRKQGLHFLSMEQTIVLQDYSMSPSLLDTKVRGKYCRHIQFYDLKKVFSALIPTTQGSDQPSTVDTSFNLSQDDLQQEIERKIVLQSGFSCLVCGEWVEIEDLLYLQEITILSKFITQFYIVPQEALMVEQKQQFNKMKQEEDDQQDGTISLGNNYEKWQVILHVNHASRQARLEFKYEDCNPIYVRLRNLYPTLLDPLRGFQKKFDEYRIRKFPSSGNQEFEEFEDLELELERAWLLEKKDDEFNIQNMTVSWE